MSTEQTSLVSGRLIHTDIPAAETDLTPLVTSQSICFSYYLTFKIHRLQSFSNERPAQINLPNRTQIQIQLN